MQHRTETAPAENPAEKLEIAYIRYERRDGTLDGALMDLAKALVAKGYHAVAELAENKRRVKVDGEFTRAQLEELIPLHYRIGSVVPKKPSPASTSTNTQQLIKRYATERAEWLSERDSLHDRLEIAEEERRSALEEIDAFKKQNHALSLLAQEESDKAQRAGRIVSETRAARDSIAVETESLRNENKDLVQRLKTEPAKYAAQEVESTRKELDDAQAVAVKLQAELAEQKALAEKTRKELKSSDGAIIEAAGKLNKYLSDSATRDKELRIAKRDARQSAAEVKSLRSKYDTANSNYKLTKDHRDKLEEKRAQLEERCTKLEAELKEKTGSAKDSEHSLKEVRREYDSLIIEHQTVQQSVRDLTALVETCKRRADFADVEWTRSQQAFESEQKITAALTSKLGALRTIYDGATKDLTEARARIAQIQKELSDTTTQSQEQVRVFHADLATAREQQKQAEAHITELTQETGTLKEKLADSNRTYEEIKATTQTLRTSVPEDTSTLLSLLVEHINKGACAHLASRYDALFPLGITQEHEMRVHGAFSYIVNQQEIQQALVRLHVDPSTLMSFEDIDELVTEATDRENEYWMATGNLPILRKAHTIKQRDINRIQDEEKRKSTQPELDEITRRIDYAERKINSYELAKDENAQHVKSAIELREKIGAYARPQPNPAPLEPINAALKAFTYLTENETAYIGHILLPFNEQTHESRAAARVSQPFLQAATERSAQVDLVKVHHSYDLTVTLPKHADYTKENALKTMECLVTDIRRYFASDALSKLGVTLTIDDTFLQVALK